MIRTICLFILMLFPCLSHCTTSPFAETNNLPIAYQGRFRSLDAAARMWLYENYHAYKLKAEDIASFNVKDSSALTLYWKYHLLGHSPLDHSPLFWIHYADVKTLLFPDHSLKQERYSYQELLAPLQKPGNDAHHFDNKGSSDELNRLISTVALYAQPSNLDSLNDKLRTLVDQMKDNSPVQIAAKINADFPLVTRLKQIGSTMKMLPSRLTKGEWISLHALRLLDYNPKTNRLEPIGNFTEFSDQAFKKLLTAYKHLEETTKSSSEATDTHLQSAVHAFVLAYNAAYSEIEGKPYYQAAGKQLVYPSTTQLKAETLYLQIPLIEFAICAYCLALVSILFSYKFNKKWILTGSMALVLTAFFVHTCILLARSYILARPPVSNMFETVIYVPWIGVALGLFYHFFTKSRLVLVGAILASIALLLIQKLTGLSSKLENVQAVLDSQYWLIIHVLMVVGSYGAFVVSGILGHFYLFSFWKKRIDSPKLAEKAKAILYTMYVGVAMLIPGTILGGVWAAESWGRFWDWDPKESWAFISACVYLLFIHAYTFRRIGDLGIAVGSVVGLMAISFTWYGVNYVLGSGLHTYGFGSGGEIYYFAYLFFEAIFLAFSILLTKRKNLLETK